MPATLPSVLVDTEWVAQHATDAASASSKSTSTPRSTIRDTCPGAVGWNWNTELCDTLVRDIVPAQKLEELLGKSGIDNKTAIVLYGDNNNWFAAWAFWQLKIYGHEDVRIMDGGRKKWLAEARDLSTDKPRSRRRPTRPASRICRCARSCRKCSRRGKQAAAMVDVRSPAEFTGEILARPDCPETCQRGGHIPARKAFPGGKNCNEDGTFKSYDELKALYAGRGSPAINRSSRTAASANDRASRGSR
jgi:thiosulfate/3-mercaptopyruvate sulfurtransferase